MLHRHDFDRLITQVRANARRKNMGRIGETHEALVERPARRGNLMLARTRTNHLVLLELPRSSIGQSITRSLLPVPPAATFTGSVIRPAAALAVL